MSSIIIFSDILEPLLDHIKQAFAVSEKLNRDIVANQSLQLRREDRCDVE